MSINFLDSNNISTIIPIQEIPEKLNSKKIRICVISDTHETHEKIKIPPCDILIHTGDILMTNRYRSRYTSIQKIKDFIKWTESLPVKDNIIIIGGNHDFILEETKNLFKNSSKIIYLENEIWNFKGFNFIGCPYSSGVSGNNSFQSLDFKKKSDSFIEKVKKKNLKNIILLTHGPLDDYRKKLEPLFHLYGHNHNTYRIYFENEIVILNSTIVDIMYEPINHPIVFDIPNKEDNLIQIEDERKSIVKNITKNNNRISLYI